MTDDEYAKYLRRLEESGKGTNQSFGLDALLESQITSQELIDELQLLSQKFAKQQINERNIGTNINQIAKVANSTGCIDSKKLDSSLSELHTTTKERNELWQSLRSYLAAKAKQV